MNLPVMPEYVCNDKQFFQNNRLRTLKQVIQYSNKLILHYLLLRFKVPKTQFFFRAKIRMLEQV